MARPKKYRTQQERRTANNASAQKYRQRNCDELKARRQEKAASARHQVRRAAELKKKQARQEKTKKLERESQDQERLRAKAEEEKRQNFIKQAMDNAERISKEHDEFIVDRKTYVEGLYHEYVNSGLNGALGLLHGSPYQFALWRLWMGSFASSWTVSTERLGLLANGVASRRYVTRFNRQCYGSMTWSVRRWWASRSSSGHIITGS
ncbi:hypothetical protein PQX77_022368 [Marasmius sp. AFHP31]|nr:hypothetical protein PQX77_022368 [Marasmius sp. AFHP31]